MPSAACAAAMAADGTDAVVCLVCFEELRERRIELTKLDTGNGNVFRRGDCGHEICCSCMAKHVACQVEEQRVNGLRCPAVGCQNRLHERDFRQLVARGFLEEKVVSRFVELSTRDFAARAKEFEELKSEERPDYALLRRLWETTRLCPKCSIALEKSEGCNSFYCVCGHRFDFANAPPAIASTGVKKFGRLLSLAEALRSTVRDAEQEAQRHGGLRICGGALRLSQATRIPLEEAVALCKSAQQGESGARERIRELRRPASAVAVLSSTVEREAEGRRVESS